MVLRIPSWLKVTSSKSLKIQSVVIDRVQYRPGQDVEVAAGKSVDVWCDKKGKLVAVVTGDDGLSVQGLHADGSKKSV